MSQDFADSIDFRLIVNPALAVGLGLLSCLRDISSLAFASILSLLALAYTGILMMVELPFYSPYYHKEPLFEVKPFIFDWNFASACSMSFFAFTC